ncbi:MAG: DUF2188 domain-containing protein [Erysipelotrichales bacterium]|nr:DUF2188 domain-containing protein [Erysipelotrichales bacterium]
MKETKKTVVKKEVKKEPKKTVKKETVKKEVVKKEAAPAKKVATKKEVAPAKYKDKARVYHISKNDENWQVKLAGGEKAIKLFKTQKEAIDYANSLVETQGGSIRIHSLKGKIRK